MKRTIFTKNKSYTFSDYFEMTFPPKDIGEEFGYAYRFEELILPHSSQANDSLGKLHDAYLKKLPHISLNSEAAKREFYIGPLLFELLEYIPADINVEYPLDAGEHLSGALDYFVKYHQNIVIMDAKRGDLEKGFNQLAVELIALDKVGETENDPLYGAVTLGDIWRFGVLHRAEKRLQKDMNGYIIPADLKTLFAILLGILNPETSSSERESKSW